MEGLLSTGPSPTSFINWNKNRLPAADLHHVHKVYQLTDLLTHLKANRHMVRNHQDGYPYINLALFFVIIYRNVNFLGKKRLVNEFRTAMGGGLLGISKKIISIFKT